jgi:hypothetical protein
VVGNCSCLSVGWRDEHAGAAGANGKTKLREPKKQVMKSGRGVRKPAAPALCSRPNLHCTLLTWQLFRWAEGNHTEAKTAKSVFSGQQTAITRDSRSVRNHRKHSICAMSPIEKEVAPDDEDVSIIPHLNEMPDETLVSALKSTKLGDSIAVIWQPRRPGSPEATKNAGGPEQSKGYFATQQPVTRGDRPEHRHPAHRRHDP